MQSHPRAAARSNALLDEASRARARLESELRVVASVEQAAPRPPASRHSTILHHPRRLSDAASRGGPDAASRGGPERRIRRGRERGLPSPRGAARRCTALSRGAGGAQALGAAVSALTRDALAPLSPRAGAGADGGPGAAPPAAGAGAGAGAGAPHVLAAARALLARVPRADAAPGSLTLAPAPAAPGSGLHALHPGAAPSPLVLSGHAASLTPY